MMRVSVSNTRRFAASPPFTTSGMSRGRLTRSVRVSTPPWNTSLLRRRSGVSKVMLRGGGRHLAEESRLDAAL